MKEWDKRAGGYKRACDGGGRKNRPEHHVQPSGPMQKEKLKGRTSERPRKMVEEDQPVVR